MPIYADPDPQLGHKHLYTLLTTSTAAPNLWCFLPFLPLLRIQNSRESNAHNHIPYIHSTGVPDPKHLTRIRIRIQICRLKTELYQMLT
jgi:hypothetical protein